MNRGEATVTGLNCYHRWYILADALWASQDPLRFGGGDTNLSRSRANDATNMMDPSGLAGKPTNINPAVKDNFGKSFPFTWNNPAFLPVLLQRVTVSGTFTINDEGGRTSSISWEESYLEAWTYRMYPDGSSRIYDSHNSGSRLPAGFLARIGGFTFVADHSNNTLSTRPQRCGIASWDFEQTATFEMTWTTMPKGWGNNQFHSGAHEFSITNQTVNQCGHGPVANPKRGKPFDKMLFPNKNVGEMPAFPAGGTIVTDTDTWHIDWEEGDPRPDATYKSTGYR